MEIERGAEPLPKVPRPRAPLFQGAWTVRRAGPSDLGAIVRMRIEFERITRDFLAMDEGARRDELKALLGPDLESGALVAWIAEAEDRAIGQAALRAARPRGPHRLGQEREAELFNVYVEPAFRRRGIGSALVAEALAEVRARGIGRVTLQPTEDSRRIYERAGFRGQGGRMILDASSRGNI